MAEDHDAYIAEAPEELRQLLVRLRGQLAKALPDADEIIDAVSLYLRACTPLPFLTQREYWGVSCLPAARLGDRYTRVVTINMGMLEMLWINDGPGGTSVSVCTDYQFLPA